MLGAGGYAAVCETVLEFERVVLGFHCCCWDLEGELFRWKLSFRTFFGGADLVMAPAAFPFCLVIFRHWITSPSCLVRRYGIASSEAISAIKV